MRLPNTDIESASVPSEIFEHFEGERMYELTNHLGNVLSTVSDSRVITQSSGTITNIEAVLVSYTDYYPFGSPMPERQGQGASAYRYGFNGKEKDDEFSVEDGSYYFGARMYDARLGRWWSVDKMYYKTPAISAFTFCWNSPMLIVDFSGNEGIVSIQRNANGGGIVTVSSVVYVTGVEAKQEVVDVLNNEFKGIATGGTFVDDNGSEWQLVFDVEFKFEPDKSKIELKTGENIVELTSEHIRSHAGINGSAGKIRSKDGENGEWITTVPKQLMGNGAKIESGHGNLRTVTHEVLHLLGLSDRYTDIPIIVPGRDENDVEIATTSISHKGWDDDIMSLGMGFSAFHVKNFINWAIKNDNGDAEILLDVFVDRDPETAKLIPLSGITKTE